MSIEHETQPSIVEASWHKTTIRGRAAAYLAGRLPRSTDLQSKRKKYFVSVVDQSIGNGTVVTVNRIKSERKQVGLIWADGIVVRSTIAISQESEVPHIVSTREFLREREDGLTKITEPKSHDNFVAGEQDRLPAFFVARNLLTAAYVAFQDRV